MILSLNMEYSGNCQKAVDFYADVFSNSFKQSQPYKEMPMADVFGIKGEGLDMIWKAVFETGVGDFNARFEMADSLMGAIQNRKVSIMYKPSLCITHNDDNYLKLLSDKLYGSEHSRGSEGQTENNSDMHGVNWVLKKDDVCGIYYCFDFDGFCGDAVRFYESVFDLKADSVIRYTDSPYSGETSSAGMDKIYDAVIKFPNGNQLFALKMSDTTDSARNGLNSYNPDALLFYKGKYNPVLTLKDTDTEYLKESFKKLSAGAKLNRPIEPDNDGKLHGSLIDRYGICWHFNALN